MKLFKNILEKLLHKEKFIAFTTMDKIFLKIFSTYFDSVIFIKITEQILFIGIKIPQLVAHFTSLKQHIINQFIQEKINIIDIKFFYYNQKKNIIKEKKQQNECKKLSLLESSHNKKEVCMIIEKKCYKKESKPDAYIA